MATTTGPETTPALKAGSRKPGLLFKAAQNYLVPFALYLILSLIFSWPLVLHLSDAAVRVRSGDVWQNLWNIWWVRYAVFNLHTNPFHTSLLFYPDSPTLYLHALNPLAGILSSPLQVLLGLVPAFNLLVILMISLSAFCAFLLGRFLGLSRGGALLAGTIFAYSPIISSQLDQGQLEQIMPLWLPLYILFFLKTVRSPDLKKKFWQDGAGAAICFLFTALTTWYYALDLVLFSFFSGVWFLVAALTSSRAEKKPLERIRPLLIRLGGVALLCCLFVGPLLYPTFKEASSTSYAVARNSSVLYNSADIVHFFRPGSSLLWFTKAEPEYEFQWFLGFIPLVLAIYGAIKTWRRTRFWLATAFFFLILSLGPVLKIGLENYTFFEWLPLGWLQLLPLGSIVRVPIRFVTFTMLCLGIAAAIGLDKLVPMVTTGLKTLKFKTKFGSVVAGAFPALALGLVFLEFFPGPRTMQPLELPAFLSQIKNGAEGAVLEMPQLKVQPLAMYDQTVHAHPIIGGYLARKPNFDFMDRTPGLRELVNLALNPDYKEFSSNDLAKVGLPLLQLYHIRWIILHHDYMTPEDETASKTLLLQILGPLKGPTVRDGPTELITVPDTSGGAVDGWGEITKVEPNKGWYDLEGKADDLHRWSAGEGQFYLYNPDPQPHRFRFEMGLYTYAVDRTITFWLNGQPLEPSKGTRAITPALQPEVFEITLPSGLSTLGLTGSGASVRPIDREGGNDKRRLSFGVKNLKLTLLN